MATTFQQVFQKRRWCQEDEQVMKDAALGGKLEVVQWLRGEGCEWDEETCISAALMGQLEVLQWLRAEGCPWDAATCYVAVNYGHVEVLRWARENGAPWDADTRDEVDEYFGYTDNFGNLIDYDGNYYEL